MDDDVEVGRRIAAARKRAGMKTRKELTDRAGIPRLGPATLGKIERGERPLGPHEAPLLARAVEVPVAYFYESDGNESQLDQVTTLLRENQQMLRALVQHAGIVPAQTPAKRAMRAVLEFLEGRADQGPPASQTGQ